MVRWLKDPVVSTNLGLRSSPTLARTRAFIASSRAPRDGSPYARAILLGARHVGTVVLDQIDLRVGKARLHIYVGDPEARGHGVAQRAVALVVAQAFEELSLRKVWLTVHVRNKAAIRAYTAAGFEIEGVHRGEFLLGDEVLDELYMGRLRHPTEP